MKHDRTDSASLREWGKNLLIVLLTGSALFLLTRTGFGQQMDLTDRLHSFTDQVSQSASYDDEIPSGLIPVTAVITGTEGRCGIQYDPAWMEEFFFELHPLLSAALLQADSPQADTDWLDALQQPGVYLEFLSPISRNSLTAWLNHTDLPNRADLSIGRIIITEDALWYQDEAERWYHCAFTGLDTQLSDLIDRYSPTGAHFAFETALYSDLAPYTLILPDLSGIKSFSLSNALSEESIALTSQVRLLGFDPHGLYRTVDGQVVKDDSDTLRVLSNGTLLYTSAEGSTRLPISAAGETATLAEATLAAWDLVEKTVARWSGDAQVTLSNTSRTDDAYTFTFSYLLEGCRVILAQSEAAVITIQGSSITSCTLRYCTFTQNGLTSQVLPMRQAAAALDSLDSDESLLRLSLQEGTNGLTPVWYAE